MKVTVKPPMTVTAPPERVQKFLARQGVASRRAVEAMVTDGRVQIDGRVAGLGDKVGPGARITVDGRPVESRTKAATPMRVIAYNKPEGEITTRDDPRGRPTVFASLPALPNGRWVAVGRLDINSRGLLLFTTDGDLAHRLMHPKFGLEREYLCRVYGPLRAGAIDRLRAGVKSGRDTLRFESVRRLRASPDGDDAKKKARNLWYAVVVSAGRYREVRRAWEAVGARVSRLIRVRYGSVILPKTLRPGEWQELQPAAIAKLLESPPPPINESTNKTAAPARRKSAARTAARGG